MSDETDDDDAAEPMIAGEWRDVPSAFPRSKTDDALISRQVRKYASMTTSVLSTGLSVTSNAKHLTLVGVGGAAALGAGTAGLGLMVAGGVMTAVGIGTASVSAYKTNAHINGLKTIQAKGASGCRCLAGGHDGEMAKDHAMIADQVLPYIIKKKTTKLRKKNVGMVGLSLATSVHRIGKSLYKSAKGTKGVRRTHYANILARHTVTHECGLAAAIVSELYSEADYRAIRQMTSKAAGELLAAKMKSV